MRKAIFFLVCAAPLMSLAGILAQAGMPAALTPEKIAAIADVLGPPLAVWSPNSRYLARSVAISSSEIEFEVLDAYTGRVRLRAPAHSFRVVGWTANSNELLCADDRSIFKVEFPSGRKRTLLESTQPIASVHPSPNGKWIAFARADTIFLLATANGRVRALTPMGSDRERMGVPDPMLAREFHQSTAYWWSPDSSSIAWLQTREPALPPGRSESHGGDPIPTVGVFVTDIATLQTTRIDTGAEADCYVPRVQWLPDSKRLAVQRLNREQTTLELLIAQASTGASTLALKEADPYWINVHDDLTFLERGDRFIWSSERSGYRHLYLYALGSARPPIQLTRGPWEVTRLVHVDEGKQLAYFISTQASPIERQLYSVGLDGTGLSRITQTAGTHTVTFSPNGRSFLDTFSTASSTPCQSITRSERVQQPISLGCASAPAVAHAVLAPVNFLRISSQDGTPMDAMMIKPPGFDPHRRYPVLVYNNAGPGKQGVVNGWTGWISLWHQYMAAQGFIVFAADNRGAAGHGHVFEEPLHFRLGAQEISDIRDVVHYLRTLPYVDGARIGIWGAEYGGFLTLHAIFKDPTDFRCAAAVSPIADLHDVSTVFAERYLGLLASHRNEFEESAPLEAADRFRGKLLLASAPGANLTLQRRLEAAHKPFEAVVLSSGSGAALTSSDLPILLPKLSQFFLAGCIAR